MFVTVYGVKALFLLQDIPWIACAERAFETEIGAIPTF
jgi:hypothetical protein